VKRDFNGLEHVIETSDSGTIASVRAELKKPFESLFCVHSSYVNMLPENFRSFY